MLYFMFFIFYCVIKIMERKILWVQGIVEFICNRVGYLVFIYIYDFCVNNNDLLCYKMGNIIYK